MDAVLQPVDDGRHGTRNLAGHERFAPRRPFVIEQDAVGSMDAVCLAVVDRDPVGVKLRDAVRAAGTERRRLVLRSRLRIAEELRGRCLVEADRVGSIQNPQRLQQPQRAECIAVGGVLRCLEAHLDVALGGEVVDLVGSDLLDQPDQAGGIGEIAVVQKEPGVGLVRILVEVIDAFGVEGRGPALDPVNHIALAQQQLRQERPVLAGDAGDQCNPFRHGPVFRRPPGWTTRRRSSSNRMQRADDTIAAVPPRNVERLPDDGARREMRRNDGMMLVQRAPRRVLIENLAFDEPSPANERAPSPLRGTAGGPCMDRGRLRPPSEANGGARAPAAISREVSRIARLSLVSSEISILPNAISHVETPSRQLAEPLDRPACARHAAPRPGSPAGRPAEPWGRVSRQRRRGGVNREHLSESRQAVPGVGGVSGCAQMGDPAYSAMDGTAGTGGARWIGSSGSCPPVRLRCRPFPCCRAAPPMP